MDTSHPRPSFRALWRTKILLCQIVEGKYTRSKNYLLKIKRESEVQAAKCSLMPAKKGSNQHFYNEPNRSEGFFFGALFLFPWVGIGHTLSSTLPNFWPIIMLLLSPSLVVGQNSSKQVLSCLRICTGIFNSTWLYPIFIYKYWESFYTIIAKLSSGLLFFYKLF